VVIFRIEGEIILPPVPDPKVREPGNLYQHSRNRDVRWKRIIISDKEIRTWFETKYITAGGKQLQGLVNRRKDEANLYFKI
jgi:hypothetical protein